MSDNTQLRIMQLKLSAQLLWWRFSKFLVLYQLYIVM